MIARRAFVIGTISLAVPASAAPNDIAMHLLALANDSRARSNRHGLHANRRLATAARGHAQRMLDLNHLSHTAGGTTMKRRVRAVGYQYRRLTENIAWLKRRQGTDAAIAAVIHQMWMDSSGHKTNILDRAVTDIGIGVARRNSTFYAVQLFGRPA